MKRKMKYQFALASVLGASTVFGAQIASANDRDLIITGGVTETQDMIGAVDERIGVSVDQSSTWNGSMEVNVGGTGEVQVEDSSWQGNLQANDSQVDGRLNNSNWQGDLLLNGSEDNWVGGTVSLENGSNWTGDAVIHSTGGGYGTVSLLEGSTWKGDLELQSSSASVSMDNSHWQGNVNASVDPEANDEGMYISSYLNLNSGSLWEGNMDGHVSSAGSFGVSLLDSTVWQGDLAISSDGLEGTSGVYASLSMGMESAWVGDAKVTNGAFNANISQGSSWKGSLAIDNSQSEAMSGGHIAVNLQENSSWEGDMTVIGGEKEDSYPSNHYINMYQKSLWKGNLNITNSPNTIYGAQSSVNLSEQSVWLGDAVLTGENYINVYTYGNSTWIGNLDLSQNNMDIESQAQEGSVYIGDRSNWQGHIIGSKYGVGLQVFEDSNWQMTGDSLVDALYFDRNSTISFVPEPNKRSNSFSTLTVLQNLDGGNGSQFNLRTDIAANQGDLLDVRGHVDGQYLVGINNQGSAWVNPANELTIVKTGSSDEDAFSLVNAVEVGGFEYGLKQVGTDWNLYSTGRASSSASASLNGFAGSYLLNYAETQTLTQRLGDLRQGENQNGVWAKVYGGKFNSSADSFLSGFDMTYSGIQVGGDHQIALKEGNGDLYVGGMFGYGKGNLDYGVGSGSIDSKTLGAYGTYVAPTGFYADMVLKYGWMKNDYKVLDSSNVTIKGDDMNTSGLSASMEIGQRLHLDQKTKEGWYVEPQAQLTVGHQSGGSFTASNGLNINVDSYNSVLGRVGMQAGYEVKSGKNPINVYAKASYVHEFDGDVGIRFNGVGVNQSFGDSWITYGVGATAQIGKKHNLYVDIERASGGKFNQPWAVNAGYRFEW